MGQRKSNKHNKHIKVKNNENTGVDEIELMSEWYQRTIVACAFVIKYNREAMKKQIAKKL
jgi:hypothetical protein